MDHQHPVPLGDDMERELAGNIARLVARRRQEDAQASLSDRIAERITKIAGSMAFILLHVAFYGAALLVLTDLIPIPIPLSDGLGLIGSVASTEAIFLSLFVLMNQRREELRADRRSDLDLHISLLTEDELTKLATVIHRMAERLGVEIDEEAAEEIEKNVDAEQVLDALEVIDADEGGAPGHPALHRESSPHDEGAATGKPPEMKSSTAS